MNINIDRAKNAFLYKCDIVKSDMTLLKARCIKVKYL